MVSDFTRFSWEGAASARVVLSAADNEFDQETVQAWKEEGFHVTYLPCVSTRKDFERELQVVADSLELGEKYAIVAYGVAATQALHVCANPMPKLSTLVAYYPDEIPSPAGGFPPSINVLVHLAGSQGMAPKFRSYSYPHTDMGFAEADLDTFDKLSAGLAWTRTLGAVRKGLEIEVDLETVREEHLRAKFEAKDVNATMNTMVDQPYVNHVPTMTGGSGSQDVRRFFEHWFIPCNPPSLKMQLMSRTIGTDRVVDEVYATFKHTHHIPWMLPDVEPTNNNVEIALVVLCSIRGGKLYKEHIYWDQASVLVQIGLLDPLLVPRGQSMPRLPVSDGAAARKVLDEGYCKSNSQIKGWSVGNT